jgi:hypothetical protein
LNLLNFSMVEKFSLFQVGSSLLLILLVLSKVVCSYLMLIRYYNDYPLFYNSSFLSDHFSLFPLL